MLEPSEQWFCDTCGQVIQSASEGWLEWLSGPPHFVRHGFRIVHHFKHSPLAKEAGTEHSSEGPSCYQYERKPGREDDHLGVFTGYDGLMVLLDMLQDRPRANTDEWAEVVRRLHVPYWEEARQHFSEAEEDEFFPDPDVLGARTVKTLKAIAERYSGE